jgi:hypothetical protein
MLMSVWTVHPFWGVNTCVLLYWQSLENIVDKSQQLPKTIWYPSHLMVWAYSLSLWLSLDRPRVCHDIQYVLTKLQNLHKKRIFLDWDLSHWCDTLASTFAIVQDDFYLFFTKYTKIIKRYLHKFVQAFVKSLGHNLLKGSWGIT